MDSAPVDTASAALVALLRQRRLPADVAAGRGTRAPLYDMLPMRWCPDVNSGELSLTPFTPDHIDLQSPARPLAAEFWARVAVQAEIGKAFRALAREMLGRVA